MGGAGGGGGGRRGVRVCGEVDRLRFRCRWLGQFPTVDIVDGALTPTNNTSILTRVAWRERSRGAEEGEIGRGWRRERRRGRGIEREPGQAAETEGRGWGGRIGKDAALQWWQFASHVLRSGSRGRSVNADRLSRCSAGLPRVVCRDVQVRADPGGASNHPDLPTHRAHSHKPLYLHLHPFLSTPAATFFRQPLPGRVCTLNPRRPALSIPAALHSQSPPPSAGQRSGGRTGPGTGPQRPGRVPQRRGPADSPGALHCPTVHCPTAAWHGESLLLHLGLDSHSVGSPSDCPDKGLPVRAWRQRGLYAKIRGPYQHTSDRVVGRCVFAEGRCRHIRCGQGLGGVMYGRVHTRCGLTVAARGAV